MLFIFQIITSVIGVAFAAYGLITQDFQFQSVMFIFLSLTMLIAGIREFQRNKKVIAFFSFGVSALAMFVAVQSWFIYV